MTTAAAKKPRLTAPDLALLHLHSLAEGKSRYKIADSALDALLEKKKAGAVIKLPSGKEVAENLRGRKFRVVDKFKSRNSIGVGLNARRFELEEVNEPVSK